MRFITKPPYFWAWPIISAFTFTFNNEVNELFAPLISNYRANRKNVSQLCLTSGFRLNAAASRFSSENFCAAIAEFFPAAMDFCRSDNLTIIEESAVSSAHSSLKPTTTLIQCDCA